LRSIRHRVREHRTSIDGLSFVKSRIGAPSMPMAELFDFELLAVERGFVRARAVPSKRHYNPLGVVQGGFASTTLDIALGLASLTVLEGDAEGVGSTDLSVRYLRAMRVEDGPMLVEATVLHVGRTVVVAEARMTGEGGRIFALAQSTSVIRRVVT
jgi:uncharacterized protein (TIGR00369 family)